MFFPEIATAYTAGKALMDSAKGVVKAISDAGKLEVQLQAVDMLQKIGDLIVENSTLQTKAEQLQREIDRLQDVIKVREELIVEGNLYFRGKADGTKDGPFCFRCFDVDGMLVRVHQQGQGYFYCPQCSVLKQAGKKP